MASTPLLTRCTKCREEIVIAREAAIIGAVLHCQHCGTPAVLWQLIGKSNREEVIDDYAPTFPERAAAAVPGWEAA